MKIYPLILVFSLLFISACGQSLNSENANVKQVDARTFKEYIESGKGQLVDIRTPGEYNVGHIKGAINIDFYAPTFKAYLSELDRKTPIYVYCRSGSRTSKSIRLLQSLEFTEIVNLRRGIFDWQGSGYTFTKE
jgi:rhodanese-related sulfurtransferase